MKDLGLDEDFASLTGSKVGDNFEMNDQPKPKTKDDMFEIDMDDMEEFKALN